MTRIISGTLGSLQLKSAAKATRPTSDRVKESLFSRLESMDVLRGANVLDLFAGTGALGFESISRGAKSATLVEKDKNATAILNQNAIQIQSALSKMALASQIRVIDSDALKFLAKTNEKFDLVFIDPPYEYGNQELLGLITSLDSCLATGALLVVERSSKSEMLSPSGFELSNHKVYGDTAVSIFEATK